MRSKTLLLAILCLLSAAQFSSAQVIREKNDRPEKVYNDPKGHGMGMILSSANGKGFSYRYWPREFGFHISFFPAAEKDNKYYNVGVTGYKTLREFNKSRIFAHIGAEYIYKYRLHDNDYPNTIYPYNYPYTPTTYYSSKTNGLNLGAGAGYGVHAKWVSIDFFLGYGAYIRDQTVLNSTTGEVGNDNTIITLSGGFAFYINL